MQKQKIGPDNKSESPRAWLKLEGGSDIGEKFLEEAEKAGIGNAAQIALPESSPEIYKLHLYDSKGELRDLPSEVVIITENAESFSMEVFSVLEEDSTTQRTSDNYDDSINDLKVLHQVSQGQDHGIGHRDSHRYEDDLLEIGELDGKYGEILKGRDNRDWVIEIDTGPWTSKKDLNPLDYYHLAPKKVPGKHGEYMDNFTEMVDDIIDSYDDESEGLLDLREGHYERMAEISGEYDEDHIEETIERFPEEMDILYQQWVEEEI